MTKWEVLNWLGTSSLLILSILITHTSYAESTATSMDDPNLTEECRRLRSDINADLGEILGAGCEPTTGQMSKLMDNPLGNVAMFINQFDVYFMEDPATGIDEVKSGYTGILQFPKGIGREWNIINRVVFTVPSMPLDQDKIDAAGAGSDYGEGQGPILPPDSNGPLLPVQAFDGRTTGFGDMYYVGLLSPKAGIKHETGGTSVWGLGFDLGLPTATEDVLGTGRWSAGPSALYAYLGPKWKIGGLLQQYWSFDDDDRNDVNLTNLQYFVYYALDDTTSLGAGPNIIANWEQSSGNEWTVPVGFGVNKTIQFGKIPVRFALEAHYSVITPDDVVGAEWDVRFMIIPAAPSALFSWMQ